MIRSAIQWATPAFLAGLMISCGPVSDPGSGKVKRAHRVLHQWYDDGGEGKVTVRISLKEQIAEFKRGGRDIGWCYVATGKEGHGTPAGTYRITEKIVDKHSNKYGWIEDGYGNVVNGDATPGSRRGPGEKYVPAPMPYWMRLTSYGIGMHQGIIPEPGEPASHGCIRMPKEVVQDIFNVVDVGTPVTITYGRTEIPRHLPPPTMGQPFADAARSGGRMLGNALSPVTGLMN